MAIRHFLDLDQFETATLREILELGKAFKRGQAPCGPRPLERRILAMIFEKPSTRTRVSFDAGMRQLGGETILLSRTDTQLGRGETIGDTARVLSRYVDAIMIRTDDPSKLVELTAHATIPVINGLTDNTHPCQVMADLMTFEEFKGPLDGRVVTWCGDGNNVACSWIQAAAHFPFELRLACPDSLMPPAPVIDWARGKGARIALTTDPVAAVTEADLVMTDTWVSMGFKEDNRAELLSQYQVNEALMARAKPDAAFMHCLPAHRNHEVTDAVIDGPQSLAWDEAENRMHVQKAILTWCLR